jgi:hypothetical protein
VNKNTEYHKTNELFQNGKPYNMDNVAAAGQQPKSTVSHNPLTKFQNIWFSIPSALRK